MTPHSLQTIRLTDGKTPAQRIVPGSLFARHGKFEKGAVLPETQAQACHRVRVADLPEGFLKSNHVAALEQNQKIASCCRHPENHDVEALKSHPDERAPDTYVFHCNCGRKHRFFCVGMTDERPAWGAG
jgi:hypothetical protein